MSVTRFTNCHLIDNGELYQFRDLYFDNNTRKICHPPSTPNYITKTIDLNGQYLAPGMIDIQNNGIYGLNFSNLKEESSPQEVTEFKRSYQDAMTKYLSSGVTAICPTVTSNFPTVYSKVLPIYKKTRSSRQTDSLGAHLEGPFISLQKKGCHPPETFVDAKEGKEKLLQVYGGSDNFFENVTIITAAPEIPGVLDLIPYITQHGCVYSIGHTMADYETGVQAIENGCTMITHLYNAMPQPHHRNAGVVGLIDTPAIDSKDVTPYFGLICDGVHVHPSMATLAYRSNPKKCVLVTDAMHLIGLPDGQYDWDGRTIVKNGDRVYLKGTDTLAGASTTLPQCVRNLMTWANISLAEAVKTATNNAALSIGLENERGFLNPGCDADFVVLNNQGYVIKIYKLGNEIASSDVDVEDQLPSESRISAML
ncbi:NAG2 [Candida oxycetoniae]|uniref:N-acetylglucosamine-6-phosphate deacetylase n=1 Tax=Candida oxycetoniae TaxID=497107 RepID=A0AAI9SWT0_9ASCO|nr:NAG2 [Candida oxycetoniae]KAI3404539.1 NAG2 [Candida oxycetoniae]